MPPVSERIAHLSYGRRLLRWVRARSLCRGLRKAIRTLSEREEAQLALTCLSGLDQYHWRSLAPRRPGRAPLKPALCLVGAEGATVRATPCEAGNDLEYRLATVPQYHPARHDGPLRGLHETPRCQGPSCLEEPGTGDGGRRHADRADHHVRRLPATGFDLRAGRGRHQSAAQ